MARYKVGDYVRVRSYEEISCQFKRGNMLPSGCYFPSRMKETCEREYQIRAIIDPAGHGRYILEGTTWCFTDEMLEFADVLVYEFATEMSFSDAMGIK